MPPPSNRAFLLRAWGLSALACGFALWVTIGQLRMGGVPALIVLLTVTAFVAYAVVQRRRQRLLLRETSPEPIIDFTRKAFARSHAPHVQLVVCAAVATYRSYWGQFGRALADLDLQDWSPAPDLYQSSRYRVRALVHLLCRDDPQAGLQDAERALRLLQGPRVPGMAGSQRAATALVDVARLLCSGATPEMAAQLEEHRRLSASVFDRVMVDWALGVAYTVLGRTEEVAAVRARLEADAPHCTPLHDFTLTPSAAQSRSMADAGVRLCARHPEREAAVTCSRCGNFACEGCAHGARAEARVCSECHELYAKQRMEHLAVERRIRSSGRVLQVVGLGWFIVAICALVALAESESLVRAGTVLFMPIGFSAVSLWAGGLLHRLVPAGRFALLVLAWTMLLALPLGWLTVPQLLRLRFGREGRFVLSTDYLRVIECTPEVELQMSRPFLAWLLTAATVSGCLMLASLLSLMSQSS